MNKRYTDKELSYIYDEYVNNRKTTTQIAKLLNRSQTGIERALKRMGVDVSKISQEMKLHIPISEYKNICDLYLKNYTTVEIGKMYNVTDRTIAKILRKENVTLRKAIRRSVIKHHDIFHTIDTPQKAYWLGWLLTDGSVVVHHKRTDRSHVISFSLKATDKYIVERFAEFVGTSKDCVKYDNKKHQQAYFRFASQEMANDLAQYGVIPNKTGKQILPIIKRELTPFLLRGIFEGNGTVYITKNLLKTAFYGAKPLIVGIAELLDEEDIYTPHAIIDRGVIASYHISAQNASYKLFKYMYEDVSDENMICQRKYNIFLNHYN